MSHSADHTLFTDAVLHNGIVKVNIFIRPSNAAMQHAINTMIKYYIYTSTNTKYVQFPP